MKFCQFLKLNSGIIYPVNGTRPITLQEVSRVSTWNNIGCNHRNFYSYQNLIGLNQNYRTTQFTQLVFVTTDKERSKWNSADHATRGIFLQDLEQLWLQPAEVLRLPEFVWPQPKLQHDTFTRPVFTSTDKERTTTPKVDKTILHTNAIAKQENIFTSAKKEPIIDVSRFSGWLFLLRATARVIQSKDILQQKNENVI